MGETLIRCAGIFRLTVRAQVARMRGEKMRPMKEGRRWPRKNEGRSVRRLPNGPSGHRSRSVPQGFLKQATSCRRSRPAWMPRRANQGGPKLPVAGLVASAGGLDAFKKFFTAMPADSGIAFVLIPHLDPTHESLMVELLARHTSMPVVEAVEGMAVEPNRVYVIPPNKNMTISGGVLRLTGPVAHAAWQTSIDLFLRSLADDQLEKAICIILSGTGSHGTLGLTAVKAAGGMAMVQDPKTAELHADARERDRHGPGRLCLARRADAGSARSSTCSTAT